MITRRSFLSLLSAAPALASLPDRHVETPLASTPPPMLYKDVPKDLRDYGWRSLPVAEMIAVEDMKCIQTILSDSPIRFMVALRGGLSIYWLEAGKCVAATFLRLKMDPETLVGDRLHDGTQVKEFYWGNGELRYPSMFDPRKRFKFNTVGSSTGRWTTLRGL